MDEPGSGPRAGNSGGAEALPETRNPEMNLSIDVIRSSDGWDELERDIRESLDSIVETAVRAAVSAAANSGAVNLAEYLPAGNGAAELSVVLADDECVRGLNGQFRGQDKPTNVLSFPAEAFEAGEVEGEPSPLGDVIVAHETVLREAEAEGKSPLDHLRHLVVHGTLHLLGFDHEDDDEAECMEAVERTTLASLGVADPYQDLSNQTGIAG